MKVIVRRRTIAEIFGDVEPTKKRSSSQKLCDFLSSDTPDAMRLKLTFVAPKVGARGMRVTIRSAEST